MDDKQLQVFAKVVEQRNLTIVAKEMKIAQPTVSIILKKLENELGVTLFYHVGKMLIPNERGKLLYEIAKDSQFTADMTKHIMKNAQNKKHNIIVTFTSYSDYFFHIAGEFAVINPDVAFTFRSGAYLISEHKLSSSDFFLLYKHEIQEENTLMMDMQEQMYVILPNGHERAEEKILSLYDLKDEYFVFVKNGIENGFEKTYEECIMAGFSPKISMQVDTSTLKYAAIASKIGIGLIYASEKALVEQFTACKIVPLSGNFRKRPVYLAWHSDCLGEAAKVFLEYVKENRRKMYEF